MALAGDLEDIALADVLQLLAMSGKQGLLRFQRGEAAADMSLQGGRIVAANYQSTTGAFNELLLEQLDIELDTLHLALSLQRQQEITKPLAGILLDMAAVTAEQLQAALHRHVQAVVNQIAIWTDGQFEFIQGTTRPTQGTEQLPPEVLQGVGIGAQGALMEALRIHDEAQRDQVEEAEAQAQGVVEGRRLVLLVCSDVLVKHALKKTIDLERLQLTPVGAVDQLEVLLQQLAEREPLLVVDANLDGLGEGESGIELIEGLRRDYPGLRMVTFASAEDPEVFTRAAAAGVEAHVPRPPASAGLDIDATESFLSALKECIERAAVPREEVSATPAQAGEEELRTLEELCETLRQDVSHTITVGLLGACHHYAARGLVFMAHGRRLLCLDGYGAADPVKSWESVQLEATPGSPWSEVLETARAANLRGPGRIAALAPLWKTIGAPVREEAIVLPLMICDRPLALLYVDNGHVAEPLTSPTALRLLARHAGLLLESRQLSQAAVTPRRGEP